MEFLGEWNKVINKEELYKVIEKLNFLYRTKAITPTKKEVFKAFISCPYKDLKIVMLGQDPYPQKGVATGLLFGNDLKGANKTMSPSLEVLIEGIVNYTCPHGKVFFDTTLESLSKQGVLLLNTALTVEVNRVGSHVQLWRSFISKFLQTLSKTNPGIIYVLFGKQAQTFIPYINKLNYIIPCNHPAYHARNNTPFSVEIFKEINALLKYNNNISIEWYKEMY